MKVEGLTYGLGSNYRLGKLPLKKVLTQDEVKFFEKLFPNDAVKIREHYYGYDSKGLIKKVNLPGQIVNKKV